VNGGLANSNAFEADPSLRFGMTTKPQQRQRQKQKQTRMDRLKRAGTDAAILVVWHGFGGVKSKRGPSSGRRQALCRDDN
jgi:hypothetical protein